MDVQLYVYDLSKGFARDMSMMLLGTQIDAVYHTSLVFGNIEYFFGGGIQTCYPGSTHHGRPMEIIPMGKTTLPLDVILEYLQSLRDIYTPESYDLFAHNCNNFTNDFSMFLLGKSIPNHITSLARTVLNTPFGQMLKPQIDRAMRPIVQAPVQPHPAFANGSQPKQHILNSTASMKADTSTVAQVHLVNNEQQLETLLEQAKSSCAVIFFTSASCAPCKLAYPIYDELAAEAGTKAILMRVDIGQCHDIAANYSIRATPTFTTFLKGVRQETWSGANPDRLQRTVRMLVQDAFPPHPHNTLNLPNLRRMSMKPITYPKIPPLEKLVAKLGDHGNTPAVTDAVGFITARKNQGAKEATLPDLVATSSFLSSTMKTLPTDHQFAACDLFRILLVDQRVSGFFVQPANISVLINLIDHVNTMNPCPYNLRLTAIHACCNLFTTPLLSDSAISNATFVESLISLISSSLLIEDHANVRTAAASLAYNICTIEAQLRINKLENASLTPDLPVSAQVELAASLLEALISEKQSPEAISGMAIALARLVYGAPLDGEVLDACRAMDAADIVLEKISMVKQEDQELLKEIGSVLLRRGLQVSS